LWAGDVYYDLEQSVSLQPGQSLALDLASYPPFAGTALGVVAAGEGGRAQAEITVNDAAGKRASLSSFAPDSEPPGVQSQPLIVPLPAPTTPTTLTVRVPADSPAGLSLRGLSLINKLTGAHQSVTLSPRGDLRRIHSGDVKIYERLAALGRAWLVHGVRPVADDAEALRALADPGFDPRTTAVVQGNEPARAAAGAADGESVSIVTFEPERVVLRADVHSPAVLVLADAMYPGWEAVVDGAPVPILRANLMFRAVTLEPGLHEVAFSYRPTSWRWGLTISIVTLGVLVFAFLATLFRGFRH
jgi:Bacterial membrane protein YfhO